MKLYQKLPKTKKAPIVIGRMLFSECALHIDSFITRFRIFFGALRYLQVTKYNVTGKDLPRHWTARKEKTRRRGEKRQKVAVASP